MIKKYTIRKCTCNGWAIYQIATIEWYVDVKLVAHLETFSDVLVLINLNETDYISNGR